MRKHNKLRRKVYKPYEVFYDYRGDSKRRREQLDLPRESHNKTTLD